jgi:hypothetical protein
MYYLPLDRRAPWPPAMVSACRRAVFDGFTRAMAASGLGPRQGGIILEGEADSSILREAAGRGFTTVCAIKAAGDPGFERDGGDDALEAHARSCAAAYWKVVLRYNPEGDRAANCRLASWLRRLGGSLRRRPGPRLMCDLVVPPTQRQIALGINSYDRNLLPALTTSAIEQLLAAGVEPDVWVIEGLQLRDDYLRVIEATTRGGRNARCLVRAAGHTNETTRELMAVGLSVPGVSGVVFGRAPFWEPAASWVRGRTSRPTAVAAVASQFQPWMSQLEAAVAGRSSRSRIPEHVCPAPSP